MKLEQQQPVARHLSRVYRFGTGAVGLILLAFGIVGFTGDLPFFGTDGNQVFGMSSNGALSTISIVVAVILLGAAAIGGNVASNVALAVSVVFLIGGTVNFALIRTTHNFLNFRLSNVLFSYAVVLLLALVGSYGRFTGGLGHDNPYWRARHPDQHRREELRLQHLHEMQERQQHGVRQISQSEAAEFADSAAEPAPGPVRRAGPGGRRGGRQGGREDGLRQGARPLPDRAVTPCRTRRSQKRPVTHRCAWSPARPATSAAVWCRNCSTRACGYAA